MDYSSWVDTSLDLNSKPFRVVREDDPLPGRFAIPEQMEINSTEMGRKVSDKEEIGTLVEELNRVRAENKNLTGTLTVMCENYNALRRQLMEYTSKKYEGKIEACQSKKRKFNSCGNNNDNNNIEMNGISEGSSTDLQSCKKTREEIIKEKISRVYVRTAASDKSLLVQDGYQWRKYGQKVTRDNPCPRAYFKCSFAPSCPVKKKVQRSMEDQSVLVATYEGEHNHPRPSKIETTSGTSRSLTLGSASESTITRDLAKSESKNDARGSIPRTDGTEVSQILVEQMASSLTRDPNFTAALAAAISGKVFHRKDSRKW